MNDTLGMRRIECVRNLNRESEQRIRLDGFPGNPVLQGHPLQILHCNEGLVTMLADFVNRADVGMVEGRSGTGLTAKTFQRLWVLRDIIWEEFQGNKAT